MLRVRPVHAVAEGLPIFATPEPFRDDVADKLRRVAALGKLALLKVASNGVDAGQIRFAGRECSERG